MKKILIDTCIIIDVLQNREPFAEDAKIIFFNVANMAFDAFITAKSVTDIYYLTHKITHDNEQTRKILSKIFTLFKILDTTGIDCEKAIFSQISDFEDAVMVETALRASIDCIVTRNIKDYKHSTVKVYEPKEFLKLLAHN